LAQNITFLVKKQTISLVLPVSDLQPWRTLAAAAVGFTMYL